MKHSIEEVLAYKANRRSQATIKRYYSEWRSMQSPPIPLRCDNAECHFYSHHLVWNSKELVPVLDHKNGVNGDNRPENLQFLCPNCNSQQSTHGGGNRGRVSQQEGGFALKRKGKGTDFILPVEAGKFGVT